MFANEKPLSKKYNNEESTKSINMERLDISSVSTSTNEIYISMHPMKYAIHVLILKPNLLYALIAHSKDKISTIGYLNGIFS